MIKYSSNILALCDKPIQISQVVGFIQIANVNVSNYGENLTIVAVDTLGNNSKVKVQLEEELKRLNLKNANVVQYSFDDPIYKGDYSSQSGLEAIIDFIKRRINKHVTHMMCALLSQRFVKIHLDAYQEIPIYMLEDGLASYLNIPITYQSNLVSHYKAPGFVLSHFKRVRKINLLHKDLGIPVSQLQPRYLNVNLTENRMEETKKRDNLYVFLNPSQLSNNLNLIKSFWEYKAFGIKLDRPVDALLIGQNFSDICSDFYFRNEVELYLDTCELLLKKFDKVIFAPHPKLSMRTINIMRERISSPSRLTFHTDSSIPVESLMMSEHSPKYVFGFYSSAMWNIKNILGFERVYTVLGWSTIELYNKLGYDIQKQAYRKARQSFLPVQKALFEE